MIEVEPLDSREHLEMKSLEIFKYVRLGQLIH